MVRVFSWVVAILVLVFLIVALIFASIGICRGADQYELFRDLLTVILAIAAVSIAAGGYLVYRFLDKIIEHRAELFSNEMKQSAESIFGEMRTADEDERLRRQASVHIESGYTYWLFYENTRQRQRKRKFLNDAIDITEKAYSLYAVKLNESELPNQLVIGAIRNNLAYYYAERQLPKDRRRAREYAEYIFTKISVFPDMRASWEHTYNFVMSQYP